MENLSKREIQEQILYSTISNLVNTGEGAEIKNIAYECVNQLEKAESNFDVSSEFINSIFNFHNVYRPLYDLLDLATNATLRGEKLSDDYRRGVIDSILSLKKYEKSHGLGDLDWKIEYNTVSDSIHDNSINKDLDV
jgi:uncharacterized membrane-anchored protein YjiN (DUF445 family)